MAILHFVLKGRAVWLGLITFSLGLLLGLREPMPQAVLPISLGALAFIACLIGRLLLAIHVRSSNRTTAGQIAAGTSPKISL